jgi:hypothetical protein
MSTPRPLEELLVLLSNWQRVFRQERSFPRALRPALAHILTPGQRLLGRLIATSGSQDRDWTAFPCELVRVASCRPCQDIASLTNVLRPSRPLRVVDLGRESLPGRTLGQALTERDICMCTFKDRNKHVIGSHQACRNQSPVDILQQSLLGVIRAPLPKDDLNYE